MVEFLLQVKILGDIGTMAGRWLRSRSGTCDGINPDNAVNVDMDSNSTYLESEADIAVSENPAVEVGMKNSESLLLCAILQHHNYRICSPL